MEIQYTQYTSEMTPVLSVSAMLLEPLWEVHALDNTCEIYEILPIPTNIAHGCHVALYIAIATHTLQLLPSPVKFSVSASLAVLARYC